MTQNDKSLERAARAGDSGRMGKRIALISIGVSGTLALSKLVIGWLAGSTSVVADGFESAGDVVTSSILLLGLVAAAKPPDDEHPYGHGRIEMLSGLAIGAILASAGVGISVHSLYGLSERHAPPALYGVWPLLGSIVLKGALATFKFRSGRRARSAALVADAWNDTVDILSGSVALIALGLTLADPARFLQADHWGGFAVGIIVVFTGLRVVHDTALQLMDTMPDERTMEQIRAVALEVPGVEGVEKCYARKTGFQYHVDLHLEVDPDITVRESHDIATQVRIRLKETLDYIADVLVHVEPAPK
jgi:cation diffusion facilitator family transporter